MANTLNLGNGDWATKENSLLGYNSESGNYKPLPFDFTRASSATFVNKSGLIETAANGVPRIDFSESTSGALLLEPQRTNLATYSEDFSDSYWTKSGSSSVTPNTTISPDGTLNADTISNATGTSTSDTVYRTINPDDVDHTFSAYVKSSGATTMSLILRNGISGVILSQAISLTSEWQRVTLTHNIQNGQIIFGNSDGDFHLWGAQLEQGSYATSYIPTQGSAVTRVEDVCSQTPPSGIIGQTEGTIFLNADIQKFNDSSFYIAISNGGTLGSAIYMLQPSNGNLQILVRNLGTDTTLFIPNANWSVGFNKVAISYTTTSLKVFINGVIKGSISFVGLTPFTQFTLGSRPDNLGNLVPKVEYKQVKLYNTALTDNELAALTQV
jgi:hypothetical protein